SRCGAPRAPRRRTARTVSPGFTSKRETADQRRSPSGCTCDVGSGGQVPASPRSRVASGRARSRRLLPARAGVMGHLLLGARCTLISGAAVCPTCIDTIEGAYEAAGVGGQYAWRGNGKAVDAGDGTGVAWALDHAAASIGRLATV